MTKSEHLVNAALIAITACMGLYFYFSVDILPPM